MNPLAIVRRLLGRGELPQGFPGTLEADEHVLASATGTAGEHLVATSRGLWLPDGRRLGWHLISKATWKNDVITIIESREGVDVGGAVLISDLAPWRLKLTEPGKVPQVVHERVTGSIRSRHHRDLPTGGAWFVQRKVPGRDGIVLQVRPDPGTDETSVRTLASDVARTLGLAP
ncbi:hypothetical protein WEH80_06270 [Actinomycetes bacterium KLBMP 9759]